MKIPSLKFMIYWVPAISWMVFIFLLSSRQRIEVSEQPFVNFLIFKSLHVIEYFILFVLCFFALNKSSVTKHDLLYAGYITIVYALTDELHQMEVPTREGIFRDVLIDTLGVFIGAFFIKKFSKILRV